MRKINRLLRFYETFKGVTLCRHGVESVGDDVNERRLSSDAINNTSSEWHVDRRRTMTNAIVGCRVHPSRRASVVYALAFS